MTDQQRAALKRLIERNTRSTPTDRTAARASLVREGICTDDGRLAPEYRVERERETSAV